MVDLKADLKVHHLAPQPEHLMARQTAALTATRWELSSAGKRARQMDDQTAHS